MRERKSLRIFGKDVKVQWWDELPGSMGAADAGELIIHVARDYPIQERCSTVIHEALEIYNMKLEWRLSHEQICLAEELIHSFMSDNGVNLRPLVEEK